MTDTKDLIKYLKVGNTTCSIFKMNTAHAMFQLFMLVVTIFLSESANCPITNLTEQQLLRDNRALKFLYDQFSVTHGGRINLDGLKNLITKLYIVTECRSGARNRGGFFGRPYSRFSDDTRRDYDGRRRYPSYYDGPGGYWQGKGFSSRMLDYRDRDYNYDHYRSDRYGGYGGSPNYYSEYGYHDHRRYPSRVHDHDHHHDHKHDHESSQSSNRPETQFKDDDEKEPESTSDYKVAASEHKDFKPPTDKKENENALKGDQAKTDNDFKMSASTGRDFKQKDEPFLMPKGEIYREKGDYGRRLDDMFTLKGEYDSRFNYKDPLYRRGKLIFLPTD